ncbi:MAG TPA: class I SAM-dependent methyltransferase [Gemmatimonadaceae bacterium]
MDHADAVRLLSSAIPRHAGRWADLGAGAGAFTLALADILESGSRIYAVDRDANAVAQLRRLNVARGIEVFAIHADFTRLKDLGALGDSPLDGVLIANALHFIADAEAVLADAAKRLRPRGRLAVVEYDQREASRWVPYPISPARLVELAAKAGLSAPAVTATQPSRYAGTLYVAVAERNQSR